MVQFAVFKVPLLESKIKLKTREKSNVEAKNFSGLTTDMNAQNVYLWEIKATSVPRLIRGWCGEREIDCMLFISMHYRQQIHDTKPKNAQNCSLDIYFTVSQLTVPQISVRKGPSTENRNKAVNHKTKTSLLHWFDSLVIFPADRNMKEC
jgi:hypothetical protein